MQETQAMDDIVDKGIALVYYLDEAAPRLQALRRRSSANTAEADLLLMRDIVQNKIQSPVTLARIIRDAAVLIKHIQSISIAFMDISAWDIATYLQLEKQRSKGRPANAHRAAVWLSEVADFKWDVRDPLVMAQIDGASIPGASPLPTPAACPTLEMVRDLEIMVFDGPMPVVRVLAGFIVLMAHGCLRCADAQHSRDLHLTSDAIIGTTWRMKRKRRQQLWAALRVGVSGRDWGRPMAP